ncbi:MAG: ribosome recycling factor [Patescibacteria group bacterium]
MLNSKEQFEKVISFLKTDISSLRTGRATPALVEDVVVDAYGGKQPLKAVASISVSDAKTLLVDPWDKGLVQSVEVALRNSDLGINPVNDGKFIRLPLPDLTAERRQELVKVLHQKLEQAKISVRKIREELRGQVEKMEKNKEISEDDKFNYFEDLEKEVKDVNEKIKQIGEDKEKEVTTI